MSKLAAVEAPVTRKPALLPEAAIERMALGVLTMGQRASAAAIVILVIVSRAQNAGGPAEGYDTHGTHIPVRPDRPHATAARPAVHAPMPAVCLGDNREREQNGKRRH